MRASVEVLAVHVQIHKGEDGDRHLIRMVHHDERLRIFVNKVADAPGHFAKGKDIDFASQLAFAVSPCHTNERVFHLPDASVQIALLHAGHLQAAASPAVVHPSAGGGMRLKATFARRLGQK